MQKWPLSLLEICLEGENTNIRGNLFEEPKHNLNKTNASFLVKAVTEWNAIEKSIKEKTTLYSFNLIHTELFFVFSLVYYFVNVAFS